MTTAVASRALSTSARQTAPSQVFTVICGDAAYGLPIESVLTIFRVGAVTPAPLAPNEILGLINLRGKIVTATSLRRILGLPELGAVEDALAICIEWQDEQFALIVDDVGDVLSLTEADRISDPPHAGRPTGLASGVFRLGDLILPVFDMEVLLDFENRGDAATRQERIQS